MTTQASVNAVVHVESVCGCQCLSPGGLVLLHVVGRYPNLQRNDWVKGNLVKADTLIRGDGEGGLFRSLGS